MQVHVLNYKGESEVPCSLRMARFLLRDGLAKVVNRVPFTIQWLPVNR